MDRYVNVISGLPRTGKTHMLKAVSRQPEYKGAVIVSMDEVGRRFWGDRQSFLEGSTMTKLTPTEKIYRNELTRYEIKNQLILQNAEIVMVEMPMLTRENHQRPLVEMVKSAERYIRGIQQDHYLRDAAVVPDNPFIHLRVVLLYASIDRVRTRTEKDKQNPIANSDAGHINVFLDAALQFEFPDCYTPLLVDTTEESSAAEQQRVEEVLSFLRGNISPQYLASINSGRMPKSLSDLEEARRQAGIAGMVKL